jgi:predicted RNA methylase
MNDLSPATFAQAPVAPASAILAAAGLLLPLLERGQRVDAVLLRTAVETAFGASDASGLWDWKTAYEACEAATVLFLRKYGRAIFRQADTPTVRLAALSKITGLLPSHTRRSEEGQALQQFSTPVPLGLAALTAAAIRPDDVVLEPSAGTGLLAILAEISGGRLILNELADTRTDLLSSLFPALSVSRFDAAQIHDHLDPADVPSVVLMNPPFSAMANVTGKVQDAAYRHIASALARLAPGGRLVTITGAGFGPDMPPWREAFVRQQERATVVFSAAIDGSVYARHGTTFPPRLTVIDKVPAADPSQFPAPPGTAPDVATLLRWIADHVPPRLSVDLPKPPSPTQPAAARSVRGYIARANAAPAMRKPTASPAALELAYETVDAVPPDAARLSDAIYEEYGLQSIRIPGAVPHPTKLVQSAAMASVAPPRPTYRPMLPADICGRLSDAQLETVIYAGEAHSDHLAGSWTVDETFDTVNAAADGASGSVRFRRGFMLGDGTGAGKGRQSAGIILDNWLRGRRKAVWISKSDKLIEDAQRDWSALGQELLLVTPLSRFAQGKPITLSEGILFTTYATLRSTFVAAWNAEVAEVPEFTDSTLHVVSGLLLPVWKRLPQDETRVYRLQTDDGERIIGRRVSPAWAATATGAGVPDLTPDQAYAALLGGKTILDLAEGLQLRRSRVMGVNRIELTGFTEGMRDRLRAYGLFSEIISWKLRFFVPVGPDGAGVLAKLLNLWPISRISEREVA